MEYKDSVLNIRLIYNRNNCNNNLFHYHPVPAVLCFTTMLAAHRYDVKLCIRYLVLTLNGICDGSTDILAVKRLLLLIRWHVL